VKSSLRAAPDGNAWHNKIAATAAAAFGHTAKGPTHHGLSWHLEWSNVSGVPDLVTQNRIKKTIHGWQFEPTDAVRLSLADRPAWSNLSAAYRCQHTLASRFNTPIIASHAPTPWRLNNNNNNNNNNSHTHRRWCSNSSHHDDEDRYLWYVPKTSMTYLVPLWSLADSIASQYVLTKVKPQSTRSCREHTRDNSAWTRRRGVWFLWRQIRLLPPLIKSDLIAIPDLPVAPWKLGCVTYQK
jgi:hypothetical protein